MKKSQFDKLVDRKGTNCLKYDFAAEFGRPEGLIPLWVADMDFCVPDQVKETLRRCAEHGVFGYTDAKPEYYQVLGKWFLDHFGWETDASWVVKSPGVVFALATAIRAFSREGESILIQQPVYHPFANVIKANDLRLVVNQLVCEEGVYRMDYEDFEKKIVEEEVKVFLLCSPHNPVGRVWTREELQRVGDICMKHHVLVVSDEIHCDFTYPGYQHLVYASLGQAYADNAIVCTAPSKTFNLAGLQASNIWIPNADIREQFKKEITKTGYSDLNTCGLAACQAAYTYGGEWLAELKEYLTGNLEFVRTFLKENLPQIHLIEPQGTYLLWVDFRELGLTVEELNDFLVDKAHLWLNDGSMFGECGSGFQRINIACQRETLKKAFEQLAEAIAGLR